jgi:hypothetical protein
MTSAGQGEVNQELEEQNRKLQEEARQKIKEDEEKRLQAMRDAIGQTTTTKPMDFQTAAKETEEREQPPNPFSAKEVEQPASLTQPPARNVGEENLAEENKAENVVANEAAAPSPSTQTTE